MDKDNKTKLKEADNYFKKGKSAVSTGFLKWSADHISGSIHFEHAAKLYKECGDSEKAKESFIKYAQSSDKLDSRGCAADGFTQAAFLEKDYKQQLKLLKMAEEQYLIDGQGDRALTNFKEFAKLQLEQYENNLDNGIEDKELFTNLTQLYKSLHTKVFETEDNFIFNSDMIDLYMNMLAKYDMYHEAIQARQQFIRYHVKQGTIDHQIRRAYVEIICLHILVEEKYKIKQVLAEMSSTDPAAMGQSEYQLGEKMFSMLAQDGMSLMDEDWQAVQDLLKKPLFKFLNNDVIKKMKMLCLDKIDKQENNYMNDQNAGSGSNQASTAPPANLMEGNEFV